MSASVLPNLLVIVSDTFRRDHLGAYGNPRIRTPYLDERARSSVVFENHLLSSFPTMPARADLLTGTFAYTFMGWGPLPIPATTAASPFWSTRGHRRRTWRPGGWPFGISRRAIRQA
jgi:arylsulfatase A-like enzyme